jgi:hypothetical protein
MVKKIALCLLLGSIIYGGAWVYLKYVYNVPIKTIVENPRDYEGKGLAISGKVEDRVSLVFLKYFKLRDKSGEIIVVTSRTLPALGSTVRIKGEVVEAFTIDNEQLLVFIEEDCFKLSPGTKAALRRVINFTERLL